jgi:hypothetical protein
LLCTELLDAHEVVREHVGSADPGRVVYEDTRTLFS